MPSNRRTSDWSGTLAASAARGVERWASRGMVSGARYRFLLAALWQHGKLNRKNLHEITGIRPNTITVDAAYLVERGILQELGSTPGKRGRPAVPLRIDPQHRDVVGLSISSGQVATARLNLLGDCLERMEEDVGTDPVEVLRLARQLLKRCLRPTTLSVGLSTTGSVDHERRVSLYGSAWPQSPEVSLEPLYRQIGHRPLVLENDMHAVAARWLLARPAAQNEDVLLVSFDDGQFGSALLIDGQPNRGCITAANELGHTCFPVDTEQCHCGLTGCLERICSTPFVNRHGRRGSLLERAIAYQKDDRGLNEVIQYVTMGIANAVNFTRVHRLVLLSPMLSSPAFSAMMVDSIRRQFVRDIADRVQIDVWEHVGEHRGDMAGWLALANLYLSGWGGVTELG